jgi:hypothetical protein
MVDYFHHPASAFCGASPLRAADLLGVPIQEYLSHRHCTNVEEPASFLKLLLHKLNEETRWGPEEIPFVDQAGIHSPTIEGSALRNIFGGTHLYEWSSGFSKHQWVTPFEMLQVHLPAHGCAVLQTLIGSANHSKPFGLTGQNIGIGFFGMPPVLVVDLQRHTKKQDCCVDYGLELSVLTKDPEGRTAHVRYDLLAAVFCDSSQQEGSSYAAVRHGQHFWWFRDVEIFSADRADIVSRGREIQLAVYVRRHCPSISMSPPQHDPLEFWMADIYPESCTSATIPFGIPPGLDLDAAEFVAEKRRSGRSATDQQDESFIDVPSKMLPASAQGLNIDALEFVPEECISKAMLGVCDSVPEASDAIGFAPSIVTGLEI